MNHSGVIFDRVVFHVTICALVLLSLIQGLLGPLLVNYKHRVSLGHSSLHSFVDISRSCSVLRILLKYHFEDLDVGEDVELLHDVLEDLLGDLLGLEGLLDQVVDLLIVVMWRHHVVGVGLILVIFFQLDQVVPDRDR